MTSPFKCERINHITRQFTSGRGLLFFHLSMMTIKNMSVRIFVSNTDAGTVSAFGTACMPTKLVEFAG